VDSQSFTRGMSQMYVLLRSNVKNAHVYKFKLPAKKFKSRTLWLFGDSILNFSFLLPSVELVGMNFVSLLEHTVCFRACHPSLKLSTRGKAAICLQAAYGVCNWNVAYEFTAVPKLPKFVWHTLFHKLHNSCIEFNRNLLSPKREVLHSS